MKGLPFTVQKAQNVKNCIYISRNRSGNCWDWDCFAPSPNTAGIPANKARLMKQVPTICMVLNCVILCLKVDEIFK